MSEYAEARRLEQIKGSIAEAIRERFQLMSDAVAALNQQIGRAHV